MYLSVFDQEYLANVYKRILEYVFDTYLPYLKHSRMWTTFQQFLNENALSIE